MCWVKQLTRAVSKHPNLQASHLYQILFLEIWLLNKDPKLFLGRIYHSLQQAPHETQSHYDHLVNFSSVLLYNLPMLLKVATDHSLLYDNSVKQEAKIDQWV